MPKAEIVYDLGDHAFVNCPGCGETLETDEDQYRGDVSLDCPECDYHETHDLRGGD